MTVGELEELLAMLPADMDVVIAGPLCRHITSVEKGEGRRCRHLTDCSALVDGRHVPHLTLRAGAGAPYWFEAFGGDVDFEVSGRWPSRPRRRRA